MLVLNFTSLNSPACHLLCETVEALREWIFAFNSLKSENSFSLYLSLKNLNTSKSRIWGREFEGRHEPTFTRAKRKQNKSPESTGSLSFAQSKIVSGSTTGFTSYVNKILAFLTNCSPAALHWHLLWYDRPVWTLTKSRHFKTTYLARLVNVVGE